MSELLGDFAENYDDIFYTNKESNISKIYTAHNISSDKYVTLKIIDKKKLELGDYDYLLSQIEREEKITKMCKSEYIVELYQKFENTNAIIFEFENYEGDLMEYISKKGSLGDDIESFKNITKKIAEALKIMNEQGIMHRDIKPSNIFLLNPEDLNSAKLGGFDCAIKIKENNNEPIGTIVYSAPEIIKNIKYNEKCDLWSLGVTLFELYYNYTPYGLNVDANKIIETIYEPKNFIFRMSGKPCLDILFKKLLQINPNDRMTYKEFIDYVLNDNFMKDDKPYIKKYKDLYKEVENWKSKQPKEDPNSLMHNEALELDNTDEEYITNKMKTIVKRNHLFDINNCTYEISDIEKYNNIIYYDENISNINSVYEDADKFERNTPGALILCTNKDSFKKIRKEIIREIKKDKRYKFNLISTGTNFKFVMKFIKEEKEFENCIENYCIFCMKKKEYLKFKDDYPKLHDDIYNVRSKIIEFIEKTSSKDIKPYKLTKLVKYEDYIEKYQNRHFLISLLYGDLTPEIYQHHFDKIENLIKEKGKTSDLIRDQDRLLKGFAKFDLKKDLDKLDELIIKEYSGNTFYGDLNQWLNDKMNFELSVAYFTSRLMYSLNKYGNEQDKYYKEDNKIIFRGIKIPYSVLLTYERAKGKIILFSSFTSTSEKQDLAENWAGRRDAKNMYETNLLYSVVYYITNVQKSNWISNGVKIRDIAKFKNEEEVLFQPFSFYLVSKVEINDKNYTADIYLKTIGKTEILEEKIKLGKEIEYNPDLDIMQVKNEM